MEITEKELLCAWKIVEETPINQTVKRRMKKIISDRLYELNCGVKLWKVNWITEKLNHFL